jgi:hypothetical protein
MRMVSSVKIYISHHCLFEFAITEIYREPYVVDCCISSEAKIRAGDLSERLRSGTLVDRHVSLIWLVHLTNLSANRIAVKRHVRVRVVQIRFRHINLLVAGWRLAYKIIEIREIQTIDQSSHRKAVDPRETIAARVFWNLQSFLRCEI